MLNQNSKTTDFLIIGSGVAGLILAIKLSVFGKVIILTKTKLKQSNSYKAQGGIAAVIDKLDHPDQHFKDTLEAGSNLNNKKIVRYFVQSAKKHISWLKELGVNFDGQPTTEGGHSFARVHHTYDQTGKSITNALINQVRQQKNITILENTSVFDLIKDKNRCYGVICGKDKKVIRFLAKYTILATGGMGRIYSKTTNPIVTTGDGIAMASRAGVKLNNLEFIQFHPTTFEKNGKNFLLSEALRGEGAILLNYSHQRFMLKYHKLAELAPRDVVSRVIFNELKLGAVYLDIRHRSKKFIKSRFPYIYQTLARNGFYLEKDLIPITPAAHYSCGGVQTNLNGQTSLTGLYALGEVACNGLHGANRLASNSLMEALVFSDPLVESIKDDLNIRISQNMLELIPELGVLKYFSQKKNIKDQIRDIMWEYVGIVRTFEGLKKALSLLKEIKEPLDFETKNILLCAKLVVQSALRRKVSVGCHYIF